MDPSVGFFEFEDGSLENGLENECHGSDEDYDALNDETFGSAALDGDWEENHQHLSHITEVEKSKSIQIDGQGVTKDNIKSSSLTDMGRTFEELSIGRRPFPDLFHTATSHFNQEPYCGSPSNSIWSPIITPEAKLPISNKHDTRNLNKLLNQSVGVQSSHPVIIPTVKTVSELEEEMRRQQESKYLNASLDLDKLKRELSRSLGDKVPNIHQYLLRNPQMRYKDPHPQQNMFDPRKLQGKPFGSLPKHMAFPAFRDKTELPQDFPNRNLHPFRKSHSQLECKFYNHSHDRLTNSKSDFNLMKGYSNSNGFIYNGSPSKFNDSDYNNWANNQERDEYAGLMTAKEKYWLRNIQHMQLQLENPYVNDYYFVMYKAHRQKKREEEYIEISGLQLLGDKGKDGKEYEPPRLENSLGKLQVVSVNAPRKIIDFRVSTCDNSSQGAEARKRKHLLLHIEKLWTLQIEVDDMERKIRALPDCPTRDLYRLNCRQFVSKLWNGLISPHDYFVQTLCIRKGKSLCSRLLQWLSESEVEHIVATLIQNLSLISKKDNHENCLLSFWPFVERLFVAASVSRLTRFSITLVPQLKPLKNELIPALECKLIFSLILSMLVRAEQLWPNLEKEAWQDFLNELIQSLLLMKKKNAADFQPLPSVALAASPRSISSHIRRCSKAQFADIQEAVDILTKAEMSLLKSL